MIRLTHILKEAVEKPSEDTIKDATAKIDKVAKQFGFKPYKKFDPTPGKRFKVHAQWIPKAHNDNRDGNLFLYTDAKGFGSGWKTTKNIGWYTHGKPEEWFDIKKWKSVFGEKNESLNEKYDIKDYPEGYQRQYEKWSRIKPEYGERYLKELPPPKEAWREVELGEKLMTVLKKINGQVTKVPPQQMPALHMKLLKQELPKLGKITDKQMLKLAWDPYVRFKTVWDEVEYVLKIMLKKK